ncbi:Glutathione transferase [Bertholletia excelsa]
MSGSDLKLLGTKLSPFSHRIEWALKLKGVEYELVVEDLKKKSSLLLELNPVHKKVPVLVHGGKAISESLIILEYIDETWKQNPILPNEPLERARVRFWATFVDEKLIEAARKALFSEGEDQAKALESVDEAMQLLEVESRANGKKFFGGDAIGLLDMMLGWAAYWSKFGEEAASLTVIDLNKYPAFASWVNNVLQLPLINQNLPPPSELRRVCHTLQMARLGKISTYWEAIKYGTHTLRPY